MRMPWQKRDVQRVDPNRAHRFQPVGAGDGSSAAIIAIDPTGNSALGGVIMSRENVAEERCDVCLRSPDDVIHAEE
jgi:hypothetical protein